MPLITIPASSSSTLKASPAVASVAPLPKIIIPPILQRVTSEDTADDGSSSSSSDDQPIAITGKETKRKAEVLKESGKIGITIKKASLTSPAVIAKPMISPNQKSSIKIEKKTPNIQQIIKQEEEQDSSSSTTETSLSSNTTAPTEKVQEQPEKIESITIKTEEPKTPEKSPPPSSTTSGDEQKTGSKENKFTNLMTNSNMKLLTSPKSAHPKLWLPKSQSTSDQVFITDVTVNLETVTIRECKTERGFFKSRQEQLDAERNLTKAQ